jgi:hypothetical protein
MSSSWPRPGLNSVGEYQLAGVPFIVEDDTTARTVTLQRVSRAITFISSAAGASVHFFDVDASGTPVNTEVALPAGAVRFEIRCSKFYITTGATVGAVVELTGIDPRQMPLPSRTLGTVA